MEYSAHSSARQIYQKKIFFFKQVAVQTVARKVKNEKFLM
jgi:hypothetical protein